MAGETTITVWASCTDLYCRREHMRDAEGVSRHQLDDDHPAVVLARLGIVGRGAVPNDTPQWCGRGRTGVV